ncbi:hypothetical protein EJ02DRAFT_309002, partial [Clathrospora elynae]
VKEARTRAERGIALDRRWFLRDYIRTQQPQEAISNCSTGTSASSFQYCLIPVFMAHANMYTLAEYYMILPLIDLSLHKLHELLGEMRHYDISARPSNDDVLSLIRFTYENTKDRDGEEEPDEMGKLVVGFVIITLEPFEDLKSFEAVLEGGGQFVVDLWRLV